MKMVHFLRRVSFAEGMSFVLLLGIAMPLKYLADQPLAVKVFGWAHGALFMAVCWLALQAWIATGWSWRRPAAVLLCALLPFGPFILDRHLRRWAGESDDLGLTGRWADDPAKALNPET